MPGLWYIQIEESQGNPNRDSQMQTDSSSGKERGYEGEGDDNDNVCIYLRVLVGVGVGYCAWFVIKPGGSESQKLKKEPILANPVFDPEPNRRLFSGYTAIGSTIYSIGGEEHGPLPSTTDEYEWCRTYTYPNLNDVYYIDTNKICVGWKKLAQSMNVARHMPYVFTINRNKICVMGGYYDKSCLSPTPEVFNTQPRSKEEEGWRILGDPKKDMDPERVPLVVNGHAVVDGGKRVIVVSRESPHLHRYDLEEHSWEIYVKDILGLDRHRYGDVGVYFECSAVVDGVLYYLERFNLGAMFGVDLANPKKRPQRVVLKSEPKYEWIPQPHLGDEDQIAPETFLVSVGEGKLAAIWSMVHYSTHQLVVVCSTIKMSKLKNEGDDEYELAAYPLSISDIVIRGRILMDCLAVFPS